MNPLISQAKQEIFKVQVFLDHLFENLKKYGKLVVIYRYAVTRGVDIEMKTSSLLEMFTPSHRHDGPNTICTVDIISATKW